MEEEATRYPKNNMPRIVKIGSQYFIIAEQDVLTEIDNITDAIYLWFITHFIFNIKYDKSLMNVGLFFKTISYNTLITAVEVQNVTQLLEILNS